MKREKSDIENEIKTSDFTEKITRIAEIQDRKGCMVEVNQTVEGDYEIIHYNCPIANIAISYQEICKNEKHMYKDVFTETDVISKDRKSTRLNSSHVSLSYAVFCLNIKKSEF